MRAEPSTSPRAARWIGAGAFRSFLVASHLVISLFCGSWPLLFYVLAGGLGAWSGPRLHRRFSGDHALAKLARAQAIGLAAFTVIGLTALTFKPIHWDTTCSWRYCGRARGPSLIQSPFPVGPVSCGALHLCINESPYSPYERSRVVEAMNDAGCAPP